MTTSLMCPHRMKNSCRRSGVQCADRLETTTQLLRSSSARSRMEKSGRGDLGDLSVGSGSVAAAGASCDGDDDGCPAGVGDCRLSAIGSAGTLLCEVDDGSGEALAGLRLCADALGALVDDTAAASAAGSKGDEAGEDAGVGSR
jgi:hypothetical protein